MKNSNSRLKALQYKYISAVLVLLLSVHNLRADTFILMPENGGMTLGSGVNILEPTKSIPSCFDVSPENIDAQNAAHSFKYDIKAVSSIREVENIRSRKGQIGASYTGISAKLAAIESSSSTTKESSLFVIVEAQIIGPRRAVSLKVKPEFKKLLHTGNPEKIIRQCGTHVATVEHQGQVLRIIMDMTQADQAVKNEIAMEFSARARFGLFKSAAAGGYQSSLRQLAKEKKINLVIEGSGASPNAENILNLLDTNAGDLHSVAQSLHPLLAKLNSDQAKYTGYGFTLQNISHWASAASDAINSDITLETLASLSGYSKILDTQYQSIRNELNTLGLAKKEQSRLKNIKSQVDKLRRQVKSDISKCLTSRDSSSGICESLLDEWSPRLNALRDMKFEIDAKREVSAVAESVGIEIKTDIPYSAKGFYIARFDGKDYILDSVTLHSGRQKTPLLWIEVPKINNVVAGATSSPSIQPPQLITASPFLANFIALTALKKISMNSENVSSSKLKRTFIGCTGAIATEDDLPTIPAFGLGSGSVNMISTVVKINQAQLPSDSICKSQEISPPFGGYSPVGGYPDIMPQGYKPVAMDTPSGEIQLILSMVDTTGFQFEHALSNDLESDSVKWASKIKAFETPLKN